MPLFGRRPSTPPRGPQVVVASAAPVRLGDRADAAELKRLRQAWQADAWIYRDTLPELGYAIRFSRNSAARIRLVAGYSDDPAANPVPIDTSTAPPALQRQVLGLLDDLRGGAGGDGKILAPLVENLKITGEAYLLGQDDEDDPGLMRFTIRSLDELVFDEQGRWAVRTSPTQGFAGAELLDPAGTFVTRLWQQHPRFSAWADSPMRQLLDVSEELLLASRQVRAAMRSRLAGNGILAVAAELDLPSLDAGDEDPEASPLMAALTEAMLTPIQDAGHPSSVVPIVLRGPADLIDKGLKWVTFTQLLDPKILDVIDRAVGRLATGLDLPREIITGIADVNHWGAWQVDDSTFRHHLEPDIQLACDALTVGYLRPALAAVGLPSEVVRRCSVWYDPTELLTHPDRSKDALDAYDRNELSGESLRRAMGWADTDAPGKEETLLRLLTHMRTWPPNIAEAVVHRYFPDLVIPAGGPTDPGTPAGAGSPTVPVSEPAPPETGPPASGGEEGPTVDSTPTVPPASAALVAAGSRGTARLSRRLTDVDRQLRDRLAAAAHTTLLRVLDRAGNRARSKAPRQIQASLLAGVAGRGVLTRLGRDTIVGSYGLDEQTLLDDEMTDLQAAWDDWVATGQEQALTTACAIAGISPDDPRLAQVRAQQQQARQAGWTLLAGQLRSQAEEMLWEGPLDPAGGAPGAPGVPTSLVRGALAVAGGLAVAALPSVTGQPGYAGGVGTGRTISDLLTTAGATVEEYEFVYGVSERSFEPHVALDGLVFTDFTDPALANDGDFPDSDYLYPGDHDGCSCDVTILYAPPVGDTQDDETPIAASANGKTHR